MTQSLATEPHFAYQWHINKLTSNTHDFARMFRLVLAR